MQTENFCKDYLETFLKIEKPENLFKSIEINARDDGTIEYLRNLPNIKISEIEEGYLKYHCYEIVRKDHWIFLCKYEERQNLLKYKIYKK
uniref:Uncharacterized protein n=1 Tax=Acrobeloides nanus TaxID=290746 RepID=A0A914C4A4_9BILA